jgi:hypothetical protein
MNYAVLFQRTFAMRQGINSLADLGTSAHLSIAPFAPTSPRYRKFSFQTATKLDSKVATNLRLYSASKAGFL